MPIFPGVCCEDMLRIRPEPRWRRDILLPDSPAVSSYRLLHNRVLRLVVTIGALIITYTILRGSLL